MNVTIRDKSPTQPPTQGVPRRLLFRR